MKRKDPSAATLPRQSAAAASAAAAAAAATVPAAPRPPAAVRSTQSLVKRSLSSMLRNGSADDEGPRCSKKDYKQTADGGSRFTIYKVNKASRKKREKSSARKERKATKTLAIVLGEYRRPTDRR